MEATEKNGVADIIVVDDTPNSLRLLTDVLAGHGYRVRPVLSGVKALDVAKARPPDLILLDIMMPEMDGYEVCRKLKAAKATREIPVIFISALDETIDKVKAFGVGGVDYISKPFQTEEVLARVETHITIRKQQLALAAKSEELAESNEELKIAKKEAEVANEAKSVFLANMSHEVRTPLSVIMGLTDLMLEGLPDEKQNETLQALMSSAEHLLEIINDILDISKIEAGKIELEEIDFDLKVFLAEILGAFSPQVASKGIMLAMSKSPDLPRYVSGDPLRLRQVLTNLFSNALKFTKEGSIELKVARGPNPDEEDGEKDVLLFSVRDSGIGIEKEKQAQIFDVFSQADCSTARKYGGTGLGLAICRDLVELMGGSIWVDSQEGEGSEFNFTAAFGIPGEGGEVIRKKESEATPLRTIDGRPLKILLVEDHQLNAKVTGERLESFGHAAHVVNNGKGALKTLAEERFDLVLLDVEMPDMDGIETVRRIRNGEAGEEASRTKVVALTAHVADDVEKNCMAAGMDGFITKPVDYEKIMRLINSISFGNLNDADAGSLLTSVEQAHLPLLPEFVDSVRDLEKEISDAIRLGDAKTVKSAGHRMKGLGAAFRIKAIVNLGGSIEKAASSEELDGAAPHLEECTRRGHKSGVQFSALRQYVHHVILFPGLDGQIQMRNRVFQHFRRLFGQFQ